MVMVTRMIVTIGRRRSCFIGQVPDLGEDEYCLQQRERYLEVSVEQTVVVCVLGEHAFDCRHRYRRRCGCGCGCEL